MRTIKDLRAAIAGLDDAATIVCDDGHDLVVTTPKPENRQIAIPIGPAEA